MDRMPFDVDETQAVIPPNRAFAPLATDLGKDISANHGFVPSGFQGRWRWQIEEPDWVESRFRRGGGHPQKRP